MTSKKIVPYKKKSHRKKEEKQIPNKKKKHQQEISVAALSVLVTPPC